MSCKAGATMFTTIRMIKHRARVGIMLDLMESGITQGELDALERAASKPLSDDEAKRIQDEVTAMFRSLEAECFSPPA